MDDIDRQSLSVLQDGGGRLTVTELAERVRLSLSPCHRRLRAWEQQGVITGYKAVLDPAVNVISATRLFGLVAERPLRKRWCADHRSLHPPRWSRQRTGLPAGRSLVPMS